MSRNDVLKYEFVRLIPDVLQPGTIYVSTDYSSAAHLCCCGCGYEVVTPLSPTDWNITFDGESVSFHPSVGNWGFPCQSHYWIRHNSVEWAGRWTTEQIKAGRERDSRAKDIQFGERRTLAAHSAFPSEGS